MGSLICARRRCTCYTCYTCSLPPLQRMGLLDVQDIEPNRRNSSCVYIFAYNVDFDVNETNSLPFTIDETYFHWKTQEQWKINGKSLYQRKMYINMIFDFVLREGWLQSWVHKAPFNENDTYSDLTLILNISCFIATSSSSRVRKLFGPRKSGWKFHIRVLNNCD